jgi:hypothetical protein
MLPMAGSIAPPAVVSNYGHHIGPVLGPLTVKMREYRLVTDGCTHFHSV